MSTRCALTAPLRQPHEHIATNHRSWSRSSVLNTSDPVKR
jgi:hypothetical protein